MKLPQYSLDKKKGNIAADILKKNIQKVAIVNNHDESIDLGIDMRAQIISGSTPQPLFFNIQCKGTDDIDAKTMADEHLSVSIKITTINFWRQQNEITLLFLVDTTTEICYWVNPLKEISSKFDFIQNQDTIQIRIPKCNFIDNTIQQAPEEWISDILLHMVTQENLKVALFEGTVEKVSEQLNISIDTTVQLIKAFKESADKANQSFYRTCSILIENIQKQMKESLQYAGDLDQMDEVIRRWCPEGIFAARGFSKKNLSIEELSQKMNFTIEQFKKSPDNVEILDELVENDKDINYTLANLRGFMYEMVCEDDPNGDHSELRKLVFHHE